MPFVEATIVVDAPARAVYELAKASGRSWSATGPRTWRLEVEYDFGVPTLAELIGSMPHKSASTAT